MRHVLWLLALLVLVFAHAPAQVLTFVATGPNADGLSPLNENPPHPSSSASGTGLVTWDIAASMMTVNVVFSNLTTLDTAAHIHCCTNPPANAGVATTVPFFPGFPIGVTSGVYAHTFDMQNAASFNPSFVSSHGGTVASASAALLAGIQAGQAYLNIHTSQFPGGEIRGFLALLVDISIKPNATAPVPVNLGSKGKIPVAILSTSTFNAPASVDASSLTFGRTGDEDSLAFCSTDGEDVNGDGLPDLVCHFKTQSTGLESGDTSAILKGKTVQGSPFIGQQAIQPVP